MGGEGRGIGSRGFFRVLFPVLRPLFAGEIKLGQCQILRSSDFQIVRPALNQARGETGRFQCRRLVRHQ